MFEDWLCGYSEIIGEKRKILTSKERCKRAGKIIHSLICQPSLTSQPCVLRGAGIHLSKREPMAAPQRLRNETQLANKKTMAVDFYDITKANASWYSHIFFSFIHNCYDN